MIRSNSMENIPVTKAEDKRQNIQAAIGVFEEWIEQNAGSTSKKSSDSTKEDKEKPDTVPGLGFKDKEAAQKTLKYVQTICNFAIMLKPFAIEISF